MSMGRGRLEAFSDGVIAIIITIMVLELKPPHAESLEALRPLVPSFIGYVLSFIYVGIYWNNHHHIFHAVRHVSGWTLWANLHLLFWMSLIPFVTAWVGADHFTRWPVAAYGVVLLMSAVAWTMLVRVLVRRHGKDSTIASAIGKDIKGWVSLGLYIVGIVIALLGPPADGVSGHSPSWNAILGFAVYGLVACIWFVPDRRIERALARAEQTNP